MMPEQREVTNAKASAHVQARDTVERLKRAPWNRKLTTARLMALTRDLRVRLIAPE